MIMGIMDKSILMIFAAIAWKQGYWFSWCARDLSQNEKAGG